jgi:hypothetical protein
MECRLFCLIPRVHEHRYNSYQVMSTPVIKCRKKPVNNCRKEA